MRELSEVIWCQVRAVRRITRQFDVLAGQKGAGISPYVRARNVILNNDSSSLVPFSNFSEDFRQTNSVVPLIINRPTMLKWKIPVLQKKQATICFEVIFHKQLLLNLAHLQRTTWWTVVLFPAHTTAHDDLINVFGSIAIVFFQHFYATIDKSLFRAIAKFSENKSFNNIECIYNLARTPEIGQGLGRILSCGAFRPEQT